MRISMVQSGTATETKDVDVHALLAAIRNGKWRKPIEQIRAAFHLNNGDRKAIDEPKKTPGCDACRDI